MAQPSQSKPSSYDSEETISFLLTAAQKLFTSSPAISRHLVQTFVDHTVLHNVPVAAALRRKLCTSCGSFKVSGLTCQTATVSVNKKKAKKSSKHRPSTLKSTEKDPVLVQAVSIATQATPRTPTTKPIHKHTNSTQKPYRIIQQPIRKIPSVTANNSLQKLATNVCTTCLVCGYISYLPGIGSNELALVDTSCPMVYVPDFNLPETSSTSTFKSVSKKNKRLLGSTHQENDPIATDKDNVPVLSLLDQRILNSKKVKKIKNSFHTPIVSHSTPPSAENKHAKESGGVVSQSIKSILLGHATSKPNSVKKKDSYKNKVQLLVKQQQKAKASASKPTYSLTDFLSDL
ncbi:hypothetical protein BATDEDRAFT_33887 [Batrachochytrium dendrobatidis JAM81]|uniref:Uncharacterized protein n=1 Tax=Batrachochytrium dendrobatidis (strain JAM81 / FGSC 10211) TaxID=684364 RepID=F4NRN4_BATDJ|nr:uncharacterized protein BATDEDRAFT_33887 [Batrachochytrium dendrobatidis JAM81]EGF82954.1 hypothetical protein BATDEDRAFT_33887 [Batrachochytrium dendrobatidis JAM81]|eukprot:XP_006675682.1 hypothetical protein BATDEDRAFT_33887 [Batrachochytrium dendrobatidis JAM81]